MRRRCESVVPTLTHRLPTPFKRADRAVCISVVLSTCIVAKLRAVPLSPNHIGLLQTLQASTLNAVLEMCEFTRGIICTGDLGHADLLVSYGPAVQPRYNHPMFGTVLTCGGVLLLRKSTYCVVAGAAVARTVDSARSYYTPHRHRQPTVIAVQRLQRWTRPCRFTVVRPTHVGRTPPGEMQFW